MASEQTSLGSPGLAEELAESQREISIAEFFEKNKHMLGFDSGARALITAVKEAVDNALDATEEARIAPEINVEIEDGGDYYRLIVEDNGPGLPEENIPKVFGKLLYGSRFGSRRQSRGQQGIGISAAVLYSQLTSGKPAKITSRPKGSDTAKYFELIIDTDTNEPEIRVSEDVEWDKEHGTRIELEMEANMRARSQLHRYIKNTAVVNPHARLTFNEPGLDEPMEFDRATDELPDETEEIKPHPHGVELGTLLKMLEATDSHSLSGFLQEEFTRVGGKTATEILDNFRDNQYGRESAWTLPDDHTLTDDITSVVNGKGADATRSFAQNVVSKIGENEPVSRSEIRTLVDETAEDAEETHDTRFGATVRENTVEAVWGVLTENRYEVLREAVDGATSTRKTEEVVSNFAERLESKYSRIDNNRDALTKTELRSYVDRSAETTKDMDDVSFGETSRENITDAIWSGMNTVPDDVPLVREVVQSRNTASNLQTGMHQTDVMAPPSSCLAPIGEENIVSGLETVFDGAEFYSSNTRGAEVTSGDPFIAEAGIAYGGNLSQVIDGKKGDVLRFANRVPLVYSRGGCASVDALKNIRWKTYEVDQPGDRGLPQGPIVVLVHIASTNVPFTNESKDALASVPVIEKEIEQAVRGAAKDLRKHLKEQNRLNKRRKKENTIGPVLNDMAGKLQKMTGRDDIRTSASEARIMNNLYLRLETGASGESVSLTARNHMSKSAEPSVLVKVDDSVDWTGSEVRDDEWEVLWTGKIPSDGEETSSITLPGGYESVEEVTVENVAEEKVTYE